MSANNVLVKEFVYERRGAPKVIYPEGSVCPPQLIDAARAKGCLKRGKIKVKADGKKDATPGSEQAASGDTEGGTGTS